MTRSLLLLALALLAGCVETPQLEVVAGSDDNRMGIVHGGDELQIQMSIDGRTYDCGIYSVNNVVGGSPGFGAIDDCGRYAAPAKFPQGLGELRIEASFPGLTYACPSCEQVAWLVFTPMP
jgi:hypothetical protein